MAINKELIEKQAKEILDKFAIALEKVENEKGETESYVDREVFERKENISRKQSDNCYGENSDFKKRILENAPNHNDDFIIGETGGWK